MRASALLVLACLAAALAAAAAAAAPANPLAARTPAQLETGAVQGHSHVLYARSPGGALDTAARVARFRPLIERAVEGSGFGADVLEGIVFLESAGRPGAIAGGKSARAASGLTQIMAETGTSFLGMKIDVAASQRLTNQINAAYARGQRGKAQRLEARRRQVDPRFAPVQALAASVRYLTSAREYLGRNDLAIASYHMGIGNLQNVIRRHGGAAPDASARALVEQHGLSYASLYFGSAPDERRAAWQLLNSLDDDSRNYYWKVLAARRIMHLYRTDRPALARLQALHGAKASSEEVFHPGDTTRRFRSGADVAAARTDGTLLPLTALADEPGVTVSPKMGHLANRLGATASRYRALRPEALATLVYIGRRVQDLSGAKQPLIVTSTTRDDAYQGLLLKRNDQATHGYSLHTTGWAFDLARVYETKEQAAALQFVLERLHAHGFVTWVKEPAAIHVTVSKEAVALVPSSLGGGAPPAEAAPAAPAELEAAAPETASHARPFGRAESGPAATPAPPAAESRAGAWDAALGRLRSLLD